MSKIGYIRVSTEHQETAPSQKRSERVLCCCYVPIGYPKFLNMSCGGYFFCVPIGKDALIYIMQYLIIDIIFKEELERIIGGTPELEELEKIYSNSKNAFELHINYAHSLVDYLSYLVYLQTLSFKDPIIEERIWKLHLSNNLNYLPKNVCFKQKEKEMLSEYLKK